jgi:hypothetical protein
MTRPPGRHRQGHQGNTHPERDVKPFPSVQRERTVPSADAPFLSLMLRLDPVLVADVLAAGALRTASPPVADEDPTGTLDAGLLRAVLRTMHLLDTPEDIPALAPLALRELVYRLATADRGHRLRWPATDNAGPGARIARAVSWLKANYAQPCGFPRWPPT